MRGCVWMCGFASPIEALDSRHYIEVPVQTQEWKTMLATERRNPKVIGGNWLSGLSQLDIDCCIVMCSLHGYIQHAAIGNQTIQPATIPVPVPGLCDAIAKFPDDHYWEG